jgi:hypothetical protein
MTKTLSLWVYRRLYQARQQMLRPSDVCGFRESIEGGETWSSMRIVGPITVRFTSPWITKVCTSFIYSSIQIHDTDAFIPHVEDWTTARKRSFFIWSANLLVFVDNTTMFPSNRHHNTRANSKKRNEVFTGIVRSANNVKRYGYIHRESLKMKRGGQVQIFVFLWWWWWWWLW